jgi:DNA invertase Pin-like site-specific DNA recombinase
MVRVYSYMRFSDPRQSDGSSAARQLEYAERWAAGRGLVLDASLSMRDEGLSAFHQRHVSVGALGVFLRAVEAGRIDAGSVLIVEGLDRLSRAEPIQAQAQLAQIVNAGITVVTACDGREYNRERLKAQPMDLVYSLLVMIRAHEESDTKSKRVRAAIRRQCEGWIAGSWRGIIRNGKDPHWLRWSGAEWEVIESRAESVRYAVRRYLEGVGGVQIVREMHERGLAYTDSGGLGAKHLYKVFKNRNLIGDRDLLVGGESFRLMGYYPALISEADFAALGVAASRRQGRRGVGVIPSILTGTGICTCGYCGRPMAGQNIMDRGRMPNGLLWPGHRRLFCTHYSSGGGCPVPGSIQAGVVERAMVLYCCDQVRLGCVAVWRGCWPGVAGEFGGGARSAGGCGISVGSFGAGVGVR